MAAGEESGRVGEYLLDLQGRLAAALGKADGTEFKPVPWESELGSGTGMLLERGKAFERAGVSFSRISARELPAAATAKKPELAGRPYEAMGVSMVLHPNNPFAPTAHLNVRHFATAGDDRTWWFGGGADLTPHYGFEEDCRHFHGECRKALDAVDEGLYPDFKRACDDYFHIRHRGQMRGIGGVFFDDFAEGGFERSFEVMRAVGEAFLPAYLPILERRLNTPFEPRHRAHQLHRRGRYAEFNLVCDRGTLFGLQSGGRADAILMSLPPLAGWDSTAPERDPADEEELAKGFLVPRDWA